MHSSYNSHIALYTQRNPCSIPGTNTNVIGSAHHRHTHARARTHTHTHTHAHTHTHTHTHTHPHTHTHTHMHTSCHHRHSSSVSNRSILLRLHLGRVNAALAATAASVQGWPGEQEESVLNRAPACQLLTAQL